MSIQESNKLHQEVKDLLSQYGLSNFFILIENGDEITQVSEYRTNSLLGLVADGVSDLFDNEIKLPKEYSVNLTMK